LTPPTTDDSLLTPWQLAPHRRRDLACFSSLGIHMSSDPKGVFWAPSALAFCAIALCVPGCASPLAAGRSPLLAPLMSPDSVVLDIVFVRFPYADAGMNESFWNDIDEQSIDATLRQRWTQQGLTAGVMSDSVPPQLAALLPDEDLGPAQLERTQTTFDEDPLVTSRHVQARSGKLVDIVTSSTYDQLSLIDCDDSGRITGRTYRQAECRFLARAYPQADGRVRIELIPEIQYGELRPQLVTDGGTMRFEPGRGKVSRSDLKLQATVRPGEFLAVGCLPSARGSLGQHFFVVPAQDNQPAEQKLLLIRVVQTQYDDTFATPPPTSDPLESLLAD
jgi:hypothetical protein